MGGGYPGQERTQYDWRGGPGPKELSGIYNPGGTAIAPAPVPEQDQPDYPAGMLLQPNVSSDMGSLQDATTAEWDGVTYIIPRNGLSDPQAIERFLQNGKHMGAFDSLENANLFLKNDDEVLNDYFSPGFSF